ncbi:hypothetical protein GYMLUDRAFT_48964 [Collybiopsis luxurians FD-317 M1]|uniref:Uncharacterized protein n=1 Tax=Collybiopsis luxurians FD-317 M1 TaxID=944289 RepID=A0A0D0BWR4_9AGAR|nr:hypothetical protein GYMLUDRAFT_48964 [Collybiopsis luxurians FD-317 M1]
MRILLTSPLVLALLTLFATTVSATPLFGFSKKGKSAAPPQEKPSNFYIISLFDNPDCSGVSPYHQIISGFVVGKESHDMPPGHKLKCVEMVNAWRQPCKFSLVDFVGNTQAYSNGPTFVNGWPKGKFPLNGEATGVEILCENKKDGGKADKEKEKEQPPKDGKGKEKVKEPENKGQHAEKPKDEHK